MQIAIASGKGGTGKTTVAVNLALAAAQAETGPKPGATLGVGPGAWVGVQLLDCDVEEPNCHIFVKPEITHCEPVTTMVPRVDEGKCNHCGVCGEVCAFHAILSGPKRVMVFPELCHGCGACSYLCPQGCMAEEERSIGRLETGTVLAGDMRISFAHGVLNPGEALASPVVARVRREGKADGLTIIDAPPGASCTMVESIKGTDLCLLVTEPTPFGLHDFGVAFETAKRVGIPVAAVLNRCDIGDAGVDDFCKANDVPILLRLPTDRRLAETYAEGRIPVLESSNYLALFLGLHRKVVDLVRERAGC